MPIALFTDSLHDLALHAMLDWCASHRIDAVELGTGNFSTAPHCDLDAWLASDTLRQEHLGAIAGRGLALCAFNCSGNLLDPDPERSARAQRVFRHTVLLAEKTGVRTVVTMSGCPGEPGTPSRYPNWVTTYWQPEYQPLLAWQWSTVLEPFWREAGAFARDHGVRIAVEPHPGQAVYNTRSLLRLRECAGDAVGANLDPSHLFWQGMDPLRVIAALAGVIYHVHAKDCRLDHGEIALNGALETRTSAPRSWEHCVPGEGHDEAFWRGFAAALRGVSYAGAVSIEYAGNDAGVREGIDRAAQLLRRVSR
jgi:sugar phosphate isomerase/epimerase